VVDALIKALHHVYEISYSRIEFNFSEPIKEVSLEDPEYEYIWKQVKLAQNVGKKLNMVSTMKIC